MVPVIVKIVASLFGVGFVGLGFWLRATLVAKPGDVVVEGIVESVSESVSYRDGRSRKMYGRIVAYTDPATGKTHRVHGKIKSSSRPTTGQTREVAFPADEPSNGLVLGADGIGWVFVGIGAVVVSIAASIIVGLLVVGVGVAIHHKLSNRQPDVVTPQDVIHRGSHDANGPQDAPLD